MQKYTAIILASRESGEFDRIYTMYTAEKGLVRARAQGVRKPNAKLAGHLEPGTVSEVYVARARGRGRITSAITLCELKSVKKDFEDLKKTLEIFRFMSKNFSEEEKDARIFKLLRDFLIFLDRGDSTETEKLAGAFWWKLFDYLGRRPEVLKCVECGKRLLEKSKKHFSSEKGGVVCQKCGSVSHGLLFVSDNQIKLLRLFLANPLEKILKLKVGTDEIRGLEKIRGYFESYNF